MASIGEPLSRTPFGERPQHYDSPTFPTTLPILPVSMTSRPSSGHPMDIGPPTGAAMAPPTRNNANNDRPTETYDPPATEQHQPPHSQQSLANGVAGPSAGAAAAAQPKGTQTAFIHKLYSMLEDTTIRHLISWSANGESFVMSPSSEFSKVLAQYFKHTNISSFVRQLNMYGFHKVSDVFHTASPDSPLWEFKHGQGNFKRGDLAGLREIKRRASRHTLMHRDSFSNANKMAGPSSAGALPSMEPTATAAAGAAAPPPHAQEPGEYRLPWGEPYLSDYHNRIQRLEESHHALNLRCQMLLDELMKSHQWNQGLSNHVLALCPDPDHPAYRDVYALRQEIGRHMDHLRATEDFQDSPFQRKSSFFQSPAIPMEPSVPMSPRQRPFGDSRRPSLQAIGKSSKFRPMAAPSHLQVSPRRYGSIGTGNGFQSPSPGRPNYIALPPVPQQQPTQQPLAPETSPPAANLARRHTSADIRVHGWQGGPGHQASSPYASGQSSSAWPSSPRGPTNPGDQQLRDALAQYELPRASNAVTANGSRQNSPPPPHEGEPGGGSSNHHSNTVPGGTTSYANTNDVGWQLPGPRYPFKAALDASGQQTRRSSMASNVHSLLNPADTAERADEDDGPDERKRKRLQ